VTTDQALELLSAIPDAGVAAGPPLTVTVPASAWVGVATRCRDELGCGFFSFLTAVDWKDAGLDVVAWLDNLDAPFSIVLKTRLAAGETACPSLVPVFRGADWMERECFDMFGIRFEGHPDLRRILLSDDWQGHPLLKSYAVDTPHPPYR
jgi:NADH-quinone oxidoreductase subunit C